MPTLMLSGATLTVQPHEFISLGSQFTENDITDDTDYPPHDQLTLEERSPNPSEHSGIFVDRYESDEEIITSGHSSTSGEPGNVL